MNKLTLLHIISFCDAASLQALQTVMPRKFYSVLLPAVKRSNEKRKIIVKEYELYEKNIVRLQKALSALWALASLIYIDAIQSETVYCEDELNSYLSSMSVVSKDLGRKSKEMFMLAEKLLDNRTEYKLPSIAPPCDEACRIDHQQKGETVKDIVYTLLMNTSTRQDPRRLCCRYYRLLSAVVSKHNKEFEDFIKKYVSFFGSTNKILYEFINARKKMIKEIEINVVLNFYDRIERILP